MRLEMRHFAGGQSATLMRRRPDGQEDRVPFRADKGGAVWFRWFPDGNFAEQGIARITEAEIAAVTDFLTQTDQRDFPQMSQTATKNAWSAFAGAVGGEARAAWLWRNQKMLDQPMPDPDLRVGRICGLPAEVSVYALTGKTVSRIATGAPIIPGGKDRAATVSYAPALVDAQSWLTDFDLAVAEGMGVRVTEPDLVALARDADWLIAVGLSGKEGEPGTDGDGEIEALLRDVTANGSGSFLASNTATNNAGEMTTDYSTSATRMGQGDEKRFELEDGVFQLPNRAGSDLAKSLGVSEQTVARMPNAGLDHRGAAEAMITVIGPVLLDDKLDGTSQLKDMSETGFIAAIASHFIPRGYHAPLRMGDNAYGVVPLAPMDGFKSNEIPNPEQAKVAATVTVFGIVLDGLMSAESEITTPRLHPEDPDAAEKLDVILQSYATGRRIEVYDGDEDDTPLVLGCPYVAGPAAADHPSAYLGRCIDVPIQDLADPDATDTTSPLLYRLIRRSMTRNLRFQIMREEGDVGFDLTRLSQLDDVVVPQSSTVQNAINWTRSRSMAQITDLSSAQRFPGLGDTTRRLLNPVAERFTASLRLLKILAARDDGVAELEALMLEVIDLFQYRIDTWITGISQMKLDGLRDQAKKEPKLDPGPLQLGYFGMLALKRQTDDAEQAALARQETKCGQTGQYLQAPTPAQATTAAVLHSAHMRHAGSGAFDIDLSAPRVRLGLDLLDRLRVGMPLGAALGLMGERLLRDRLQSARILPLRDAFPFANSDKAENAARAPIARVLDGLAFVEAPRPQTPVPDRGLHATLSDALDALSDLVMAEAAYQRARGAAERANAWLSVLSGGPIPERPQFIHSQRSGHASEHRVMLKLSEGTVTAPEDTIATGLMEMADPDLAALATTMFPKLALDTLLVRVAFVDSSARDVELPVSFDQTLNLPALELLMSSREAVARRVVAAALNTLATSHDAKTRAMLDAFDADGLMASPAHQVTILHVRSNMPLADWHQPAREVAGMLRRSRMLEPTDLQPFNEGATEGDEAAYLPAWQAALERMTARRNAVYTTLEALYARIETMRGQFFDSFDAGAFGDGQGDLTSPLSAPPPLWRQCARFNEVLTQAAALVTGAKLPFLTPARLAADRLGLEEEVTALGATLRTRLKAVQTLRSERAGDRAAPLTTEGAVRSALESEIKILRGMLGRAKFPVSARFAHVAQSLPGYAGQSAVPAGLEEWPLLRARLMPALTLDRMVPGLQLRRGVDHAALAARNGNPDDPRDETEAPLKHHFAKVIGVGTTFDQRISFAGYAIDEWTETRPSRTQNATLALHYDAPQAEAPNALLLGVPPALDAPDWTPDSAAQLVRDLISWTRIRAMTTQDTMLENTILPGSNVIANARRNGAMVDRIPTRKGSLRVTDKTQITGRFVIDATAKGVGIAGGGLFEARGFSGKRGGK
ncbi:hypothetical protein [Roseivivax sp. CAU 1753]